MNKPKIFVVEDEWATSLVLQEKLKKNGYAIAGAVMSGEEALDQIPRCEPDIVLMDIKLDTYGGGKIDGIQVAKSLEQIYPVPIIFLTSLTDISLIRRLPLHYADFRNKPVTELELVTKIEQVLQEDKPIGRSEPTDFIFIRKNSRDRTQIRIAVHDILYIEGSGPNIIFFLKNGDTIKKDKTTLKDFMRQFDIPALLRISKSHIVNTSKLTAFEPPDALLIDTKPLFIGREYKKSVKRQLPFLGSR